MNAPAFLPASSFSLNCVAAADDWDAVRAVRYVSLLERGDIADDSPPRFGDAHDDRPYAMTLLLRRNGRPAATARVMESTPPRHSPLPAAGAFAHEIEAALGIDASFVEMDMTHVGPGCGDEARTARFHLFKGVLAQASLRRSKWVLTAVCEDQIGFHGRLFGMQILSGPEAVAGLALPRVLMGLDLQEQRPILERRIPGLATHRAALEAFVATGHLSLDDPMGMPLTARHLQPG
ncbi:hypothetical protein DSM104443_01734 [Usitatibacter rugosus]|uniref:N-acyl amino acid synthase FeeM catalytic core domain-containing protein n=2 Tax=Usitatibacter rugosus TaxID=2732067 RepID=A0A6M4GYR5_9PROT|nr:hypothetical protein DSM104443_01734 [Usitatibacter rugosus]